MQTCIITGANSGIGKCAARQIAAKGYRVVLACRNMVQAEEVCAQIRTETGNDAVFARQVDLSLVENTRHFAETFSAEFGSLDVLINNAADFDLARKQPFITKEGNEAQFATNLLSPFILMEELLPLLQRKQDGRIINIASQGLMMFPNLTFDMKNIRGEKGYSPAKTYYQTKLGLLMLSLALQTLLAGSNVSVYAIRVTNVKVDISRYPNISPILKAMYRVKRQFSISPDEMAKIYTLLATGERQSGFYFDERLREVHCNKSAYDKDAQAQLRKLCADMTREVWSRPSS
ncbi:SDR family NAD(P)-dependent oxidoreductase [Eubacteriales bacterium OttesenSCG-928-A19]|nr:SDR family NAD(P)-dependent oxidoreductase [Eubacteriales bacterium OttesenSCG-928-A19]